MGKKAGADVFELERTRSPHQKSLHVRHASMNGKCAAYAIVSVPPPREFLRRPNTGSSLHPDTRLARNRVESARGVEPSTSEVDRTRPLMPELGMSRSWNSIRMKERV
jgi:hypothetical protein